VINGVFWRTRTGAPWRDLPTSCGNWKTVYSRHRRWSGDDTWVKILDRLRAGCDVDEGSQWTVGADSSTVRAHQHAAGARHAPPKDIPEYKLTPLLAAPAQTSVESPAESTGDTGGWVESQEFHARRPKRADQEALGRSRGGLTTKIHLLSDSRCRPLARVTTAGQRHDSVAFEPLMDRLRIRRSDVGGRGPARAAAGRQGLLEPHDPVPPAPMADQDNDPGEERPAKGPRCEGFRRRATTEVRHHVLQAAQHRRTRLQQAQGLPRGRNAHRQARVRLPRDHRRRLDQDLAPPPSHSRSTRPRLASGIRAPSRPEMDGVSALMSSPRSEG